MNMPLMAGSLRPPHLSRSLRFFSVAHSIKPLSSVPPPPLHSPSPNAISSTNNPNHKPWFRDPNSQSISQRHSTPSNTNGNSTNAIKARPKQNSKSPPSPPPFNRSQQNAKPNNTKPQNSKTSDDNPSSTQQQDRMSIKARRKEHRDSPAGVLRYELDQCSKHGDTARALELYDQALQSKTPLTLQHYNRLLYLCSLTSAPTTADVTNPENSSTADVTTEKNAVSKEEAIKRGFEIYKRMREDEHIVADEAAYTALARLAAAKRDPHLAFDLVKRMAQGGIPPKLRSYGPALHGFCDMGLVDLAHEVESHMDSHGIVPEESELAALLQLNSTKGQADQVYRLLHKIRPLIRQVSEPTADIIQSWFRSASSSSVGSASWDPQLIKKEVTRRGGGWHGVGWLGAGEWRVQRSEMDGLGACIKCGERLVCIDIDPQETEGFRKSLVSLPGFRNAKNAFLQFTKWLEKNGPFDAVIDAANVGLCNQRDFSFHQVRNVISEIREASPSKKMPLIILHAKRLNDEIARIPKNKRIIESWSRAGVLYATPPGSNDDWYWLYAAVSCKSLLVTNDEMRDHLFQLLGTSFFPRWKEKHQVRMTFSREGVKLHMPPTYSIVIQESENGSWHIPTITGDDLETPRQWICATRQNININHSNKINNDFENKIDDRIDELSSEPARKLSQMS
ncbi:hypothetical protein LUZ60_015970 [Juncus effusus]|nr:hypothetical protein LUZ60_015970 [Juncus effusus]